jgi:uncharacterized damage-inducible protein DinB
MFTKKQFRSLFAYHAHVNRLLLDRAANITEVEFNTPGVYDRSIHLLLFHILQTDYNWRVSMDTGMQPAPLRRDDYLTLASLADGFAKEETAVIEFLERITAEEIESSVHLTAYADDFEEDMPRWKILLHMIVHGEQHQSELAYLLTGYGQSPGDLDYIDFDDPPETQ